MTKRSSTASPLPTFISAEEQTEEARIRQEELRAWREREDERLEESYKRLLAEENARRNHWPAA